VLVEHSSTNTKRLACVLSATGPALLQGALVFIPDGAKVGEGDEVEARSKLETTWSSANVVTCLTELVKLVWIWLVWISETTSSGGFSSDLRTAATAGRLFLGWREGLCTPRRNSPSSTRRPNRVFLRSVLVPSWLPSRRCRGRR
jgi:hypothetical protein